jgi:hypothetical protein
LEWQSGFGTFIQNVNAAKPELISSLDFTAIINSITQKLKDPNLKDAQREFLTDLLTTAQQAQKEYMNHVPADRTALAMQSKLTQIAYNVDKTGGITTNPCSLSTLNSLTLNSPTPSACRGNGSPSRLPKNPVADDCGQPHGVR